MALPPPYIEETGADKTTTAVTNNGFISAESNLKGDWLNFFLLMVLYTMQGFPLGLTSAIPLLLQSKKEVSYQDQAMFSLVLWPFSLKLLWAPLVDAFYVQRIGRRKTWLIPVQYLMGTCLLFMAKDIDKILPVKGKPDITLLVYMFFIVNFLAATQDIIVDGWALTMLKKHNVGHASTCNTTGQTIGVMLGSVLPILLTSEDFSNKYLRITPNTGGLMTLQSFLYVGGTIFMIITTLIAIFKNENKYKLDSNHVRLTIIQNYSLLWDIIKLPSIRKFAAALLTARVGFAVTDSVTYFKLIDAGVSKDNLTIINTAMYIVKILIPLISAKYTSGPKPMSIYLRATAIKLIWNLTFILLIFYTQKLMNPNDTINTTITYYVILVIILFVDEILFYIMLVSLLAFFSRISDPRFGGTYVTFLNTVTNLGFSWTSTVALEIIDLLTFKECSFDTVNDCSTMDQVDTCEAYEGECITLVNGYYVGTLLNVVFGFVWYFIFKNVLKNIQTKCSSDWIVNVKQPTVEHIDIR